MAKKKLSDFIVISDVDGTLIDHEIGVPKRNRDAIYRFIEAGGRFGIATGRSRGLMLRRRGICPSMRPAYSTTAARCMIMQPTKSCGSCSCRKMQATMCGR